MATNNAPKEQNSLVNVLSIRDFRLLFAGVSTSLLGDQFTLIATSWLVLQLTSDPVVLGTVLALEGIPRALFMLLGASLPIVFRRELSCWFRILRVLFWRG